MTPAGAARAGAEDPAERMTRLEGKIAHLEIALKTNRRIGAAVGIVMGTLGVGYDTAFEVLRQRSQHSNQPLRDIAEAIVYLGRLPDE